MAWLRKLAKSIGNDAMHEPLSATAVLEQLQSMGLSNVELCREETWPGWRIRADGGLIIHIHENGKLLNSGRNARTLRKALGLTGRREAYCVNPLDIEAGGHLKA
jgi:hypothetical protein